MGIDIRGGMLIGAHGSEIRDDLDDELLEDDGIISYAQYFDAGRSRCYYGFELEDILVDNIDEKWLNEIKKMAEKFKKITGVNAYLIGTQNVF